MYAGHVRRMVLVFTALSILGPHFTHDVVGAVLPSYVEHGLSSFGFNADIYSVGQAAGAIASAVSIPILNRVLPSTVQACSVLLALVGQIITEIAFTGPHCTLVLCGRALLSGATTLIWNSQCAVAAPFYREYGLTWANGVIVGTTRLATILAFTLGPSLSDVDVRLPQFFGSCFCLLSLLSACFVAPFERKHRVSSGLLEKDGKNDFTLPFVLTLAVICVVSAVNATFLTFSTEFFAEKDFSDREAGFISGLNPVICLVLAPFLGVFASTGKMRFVFVLYAGPVLALLGSSIAIVCTSVSMGVLMQSLFGIAVACYAAVLTPLAIRTIGEDDVPVGMALISMSQGVLAAVAQKLAAMASGYSAIFLTYVICLIGCILTLLVLQRLCYLRKICIWGE